MRIRTEYIVCWLVAILGSFAAPADFVLDKGVYRHNTVDRIWKPQAIYVDEDGSLLYPVRDGLVAAGRNWIQQILSFYPDDRRRQFQLRVYIHPAARWDVIHDFVTWIEAQNIGKLELRVAKLRENEQDEEQAMQNPKVEKNR